MIAGGELIKELIYSGKWVFNSVDGVGPTIGPNSLDVRLSDTFLVPREVDTVVSPSDMDSSDLFDEVLVGSAGFIIDPGKFVLASVMDSIDCSSTGHIQQYDGRSTIARLGLFTHVSAGYGDFGFKGSFTLELFNASPFKIKLIPGTRIGQVYFTTCDKPTLYSGYDQTDFKPQRPRLGIGRF